MPRKIPCVGFSISGRICAADHMSMLTSMVRFIKMSGWGIIVPLQTTGEKHIARMCRRHGVFCVGLFTDKFCSPEFRGSLAHEVDEYTPEQRAEVSRLYNSIGKQFQWDMMPVSRRNLLASTVVLAQHSRLIAVWPESTETAVAAAVAGGRRLPVYYLPRAAPMLMSEIGKFHSTTESITQPTRIIRVGK